MSTKIYKVFFPLTFILLMFLNVTLLNYAFWISLLSGLVVGLHLFLVKKIAGKFDFWAFGAISGIYFASLLFWLIFDYLPLWITMNYSAVLLIVFTILFLVKNTNQTSHWWKKALRVLYAIVIVGLLSGTSLITYFTINPEVIVKQFQDNNSFEPQIVNSPKYDDARYNHHVNLQYATTYPNSYLDIISIKDEEEHPIFFYIHGGGFAKGDKILAHPANSSPSDFSFVSFNDVLAQGFNVVTINYAFAPDYLYPTQIYQASEAISYLLENSALYGLDMNNIVLAGESAGGYIVAALLSAQVNPEYAHKIALEPVLRKEQIKAMVLESPLLDPTRAGQTEKTNVISDYVFQLAVAGFLGTSAVSADKEVSKDANLLNYVTGDFPPTFLTDGNSGTWPYQAREYSQALQNVGVYSEVYIPELATGRYGHVFFEDVNKEVTKIYFAKRKTFLSNYL